MKKVTKKLRVHRIISLVLACVMVLTMLSPASVEAAEASISTDKDTYVSGEPIMVTAYSEGSGDWVGLYTKGSEDPNKDYWFWYYVDGSDNGSGKSWSKGETYNLYDTVWWNANTGYDGSLLPAGDYVLRIEGANVSKEITIVDPPATETKLETKSQVDVGESIKVKAVNYTSGAWVGLFKGEYTEGKANETWYYVTGHNDESYDLGVYDEGTYEVVLFTDSGYTVEKRQTVTVGHIYGEWKSNKEGDKTATHSRVCEGHTDVKETENCSWNDGEVTTPATDTQDGVKTYTCIKCGGTYTEIIYAKQIVEENTIKEPTCVEKGLKEVVFDDGTTTTKDIDPLGHQYGDWNGNEGKETHSKTCTREGCDSSVKEHTLTENCTLDDGVVVTGENNKIVYTCQECDGSYKKDIIELDKEVYDIGQAINITVNYPSASKDWIGLYKKDAVMNVDKSFYYYYPAGEEAGKPFNIYSGTGQVPVTETGEYKLVFYKDDKFDELISSVDIRIDHTYGEWEFDESNHKHTHACTVDPKHTETEDCVFDDGETVEGGIKYTCTVCNGFYVTTHDLTYTFNEADKTHTKTCATHKDCSENKTEPCTFNKGVVSTEKDNTIVYTCKDCNGSYEKDIIELEKTTFDKGEAINIKVNYPSNDKDWIGLYKKNPILGTTESYYYYYPKQVGEGNSLNIYDATYQHSVTDMGEYTLYFLENDGYNVISSVDITIDHTYGDWVFNAEEKTHTRVCTGHPEEKETAYCDFETETVDGNVKYTCKVCKGSYVDSHEFKYDYNAEAKTHTKTCTKHDNCSANGSESCKFTEEVKDGKLVYTCKDCKGSYEVAIISTDKKKYDLGESINVTVDYDFGPTDWVGIYKKGEIPSNVAGAPMSFYYYYPSDSGKTFNIFAGTSQIGGVRGDIGFGEYTLYLCANDGYDIIGSIDVTIGHEFGEWKYDENTKTHSRTCDGSTKHQEGPVACTFESKVTKEPTATETGIETFTCSVCKGSYEVVLPKTSATIVKTETIDPTCEEDGKIIFTYSDGTVTEELIQKLGHDYDEESCTFNEADKTHSYTCKNDSSHVKTVNCDFNRIAMEGDKATYKCTVCGGTFEAGALVVMKDTYAVGEAINVIASCNTNESWVGLYKADEEYGSIVSYYWYYVVADGINRDGKTMNLTDKAFYNVQRLDSMTPGEYKIVLFGDGGYTKVIDEKTITITETSTTYDMKINGKEVSDGEVLQFKDDDVVNVNVTANGNPGTSWVGIYTAHYTKDTDFAGIGSADFFWIGDNNGKTVNLKSAFREPGDYCIVIFGDHGHDYVEKIVYYTFTKEGAEKVLIEPTCTKPGLKYMKYDDGSDAYIPIAKLGHDIKEWLFDETTKTHSGVCERVEGDTTCGEKVTEDCKFESAENAEGVMVSACSVCKGQYSEVPEEVLPPYEEKSDRIYGETRYETAAKIADELKKNQNIEKFDNIIIASGTGYADALSGTYLAKVKNAPILLVDTANAKNMKSIADYVNANLAEGGTVYILGGKNAIAETFTSNLKVDKNHIKRLGGATRYETNILILEEAGVAGKEILVCTGDNFADSLSASALGRPVLLVNNKNLLGTQKTFLKEMKNKKFFIIGGKNAISYDMEELIRDYGGTERISGATRYETSTKLAERFIEGPKAVILAYGHDFPDGLAGGMLALNMDAPLILVHDSYKDSAVSYAKDNNISSGKVLGGPVRISESVAKEIFAR